MLVVSRTAKRLSTHTRRLHCCRADGHSDSRANRPIARANDTAKWTASGHQQPHLPLICATAKKPLTRGNEVQWCRSDWCNAVRLDARIVCRDEARAAETRKILGSIHTPIRVPMEHIDRGKQNLQGLSQSMTVCCQSATEPGAREQAWWQHCSRASRQLHRDVLTTRNTEGSQSASDWPEASYRTPKKLNFAASALREQPADKTTVRQRTRDGELFLSLFIGVTP